jgi:hypothetical protein
MKAAAAAAVVVEMALRPDFNRHTRKAGHPAFLLFTRFSFSTSI